MQTTDQGVTRDRDFEIENQKQFEYIDCPLWLCLSPCPIHFTVKLHWCLAHSQKHGQNINTQKKSFLLFFLDSYVSQNLTFFKIEMQYRRAIIKAFLRFYNLLSWCTEVNESTNHKLKQFDKELIKRNN